MPNIAEGKEIADKILHDLKKRIAELSKTPSLAVVLVGNDRPSKIYVDKKQAAADLLGIKFFRHEFPNDIGKGHLKQELKKIQAEENPSGMIVQLPLPNSLWSLTREIVNEIALEKDVDCLSHAALGRVLMGEHFFVPPTPGAILEILKFYQVDLTSKNICIVGRGDLIGKPLAAILLSKPVTINVCGKSTADLGAQTRIADIIITGVGKKNIIDGSMVKKGAVVIDAGICFDEAGNMCGDIEYDSVSAKASLITPVIGGVGPITVAKLLENTVLAEERQI